MLKFLFTVLISGSNPMFMTLDPKRMAKLCNRAVIDKHLLHGIKQFNLDPERGIEILEERGFLKREPQSLASFLLNQERLSKKQIGKIACVIFTFTWKTFYQTFIFFRNLLGIERRV